jgi:hypothetical protein
MMTSMTADTMFKCSSGQTAKLTSTNFTTCNSDIQVFLRAENVLEIALGTEAPPLPKRSRSAIEATEHYKAHVEKAYGLIVGSCSLPVRTLITDMDDPAEI